MSVLCPLSVVRVETEQLSLMSIRPQEQGLGLADLQPCLPLPLLEIVPASEFDIDSTLIETRHNDMVLGKSSAIVALLLLGL